MSSIPKIIHLIWIGGNPKPDVVIKCIESWKKYMPDYEIIEWNESNYDVYKNEYMRKAYENKKWAFVSDFMRFDILNQYGGIYLDTDVELIKRIPEEILENEAFTGIESTGKVNPGLIFACDKAYWVTEEMLSSYQNAIFEPDNLVTVNMRITDILQKRGFVEDSQYQVINGLAIYPEDYFCAFDQDIREINITSNTVSVHHYAATWKHDAFKRKVQKIIKKVIGKEMYRKLLYLKRSIRD